MQVAMTTVLVALATHGSKTAALSGRGGLQRLCYQHQRSVMSVFI